MAAISVDTECFVKCPYNHHHVVLKKNYGQHIRKCERNVCNPVLVECTANKDHLVPGAMLTGHVSICPDAMPWRRDGREKGDNVKQSQVSTPKRVELIKGRVTLVNEKNDGYGRYLSEWKDSDVRIVKHVSGVGSGNAMVRRTSMPESVLYKNFLLYCKPKTSDSWLDRCRSNSGGLSGNDGKAESLAMVKQSSPATVLHKNFLLYAKNNQTTTNNKTDDTGRLGSDRRFERYTGKDPK